MKHYFADMDEFKKYGKQVCDNRIKYGHETWYEWSYDKWGTKWNACDNVIERKENEVCINFNTAWNPVTKLMKKIGRDNKGIRKFP